MPDLPDDIASKILELESVVQSQPSAEIYAQLADLYRTNGQLELATETCEKAVHLFPDDVNCLMTYARVLSDTGLFEEAESLLEKIIELGGEQTGTLIMMGQLYVKRSDLAGIHSIASKLADNFPNDVRAKKFLYFLKSKNLLPSTISIEETKPPPPVPDAAKVQIISPDDMPTDFEETAAVVPKTPPTATSAGKKAARKPATKGRKPRSPQSTVSTVPIEDMMHLLSMLNGIVGVKYVVLTDPTKKTMASKGCPTSIARAIGGLVRSLSRAMYVAFDALDFGEWNKGVIELEQTTVHLIGVEGYWIALLCDTSTSLGALRIAVNSIVRRQIKPQRM